MIIKAGTSNFSTLVRFLDETSGTPASQIVSTTAGLDMWYRRDGDTKTLLSPINLAAQNSAHSDGGIIHIQDGYYRVDVPDTAIGSGANGVLVGGSATGFIGVGQYVQLVGYDPQADLTTAVINKLYDIDGKAASANVPDVISLANIRGEASGAIETYDPPTNTEFEARTLAASDIFNFTTDRVLLTTGTASQLNRIHDNTSALSDSRVPDIISLNNISGQASDSLSAIGLQYLLNQAVAGANVVDNSVIAKIVSSSAQADWDTFDNTTDALEAIAGAAGLNTSQVRQQVDEGLSAIGLDHLVAVEVAGADITDNSIIAKITSSSAQADWDTFVNTTESLQAIRDRGDAAWITAVGFSTYDPGTDRVLLNTGAASQLNRIETNASALSDSKVPDIISLANIRAEASGAIETYDPPTNAEMDARTLVAANYFDPTADRVLLSTGTASQLDRIETNASALSDNKVPDIISLANIRTQSDDALSAIGLDHLISLAVAGTDITDNSIIAKMVSASAQADWDTFVNTDDSLQAISESGGGGLTTSQVRQQVDEGLSAIGLDHLLSIAVAGGDVSDNSIIAQMVSASAQADWDTFVNTDDSLQAISESGGGGLTTSQVRQQVDEGLSAIGLDHLISVAVVGADVTDNSIIAKITSSSAQADWDTFVNTDDSLQAIADNKLTTSQVRIQMDEGLSAIGLDHLVATEVLGVDVTDNSIFAKITSSSAQADWDTFVNTTESLQAIRDRGDSAWATAVGFSTYDPSSDRVLLNVGTASQLNRIETNASALSDSKIPDIISLTNIRAEASGAIETYDPPTNAELNARTLLSANYFDFSADRVLLTGGTASQLNKIHDNTSALSDSRVPDIISLANIRNEASGAIETYDPPTNTELNARTLVAANYFDPSSDRVLLSTATASQIDNIETNASALSDNKIPDVISLTNIRNEASGAIETYDPPTNAEMDARTILSAEYATSALIPSLSAGLMPTTLQAIDGSASAAQRLRLSGLTIVPGNATTHQLSTTQMSTDVAETTDDHFNGRIIIWTSGNLKNQATDITDYAGNDGTSSLFTFTAVTEAPANNDEFIII